MSVSTLGQQLAAINESGRKTGSTLSTSRRHEDSVGRGFTHSVQVGHGLYNKSHKFKPSVIHEDARKASDVPLSTIRENCVDSFRHLETVDSEFGAFVGILCKADTKERGLMLPVENEKIDKRIEDLLFRISLIMRRIEGGSGTKNNVVACLNVIEFLLRKYDIHVKPNTAATMLLSMIPHHEEPYFLRMLQLVDLANLPEWAFLRPYATPGARLSRSTLAQQASKDVALIRSLCRLSQRISTLPYSHQNLSFTAAVLVEALSLQTQRKGSMEEQTCQAILPHVVAACRNQQQYKKVLNGSTSLDDRSSVEVWQNWGYVLASTIVENCILASEPRSLLVTSILQGLTEQLKVNDMVSKEDKGSSKKSTERFSGIISSGMIVALTILAQNSPDGTDDKLNSIDSGSLALLPHSIKVVASGATYPARECGYTTIDKSIIHALLKLDGVNKISINSDTNVNIDSSNMSTVVSSMAHLYSVEGLVDFEHWIASTLVVGWKRCICYFKKKNDKNRKGRIESSKILNLIHSFFQHPLLENLWKQSNGQWVEYFASFIFLTIPTSVFDVDIQDGKSTEECDVKSCIQPLVQTLRKLDRVAFDRGVTRALIRTNNKEDRSGLMSYLGLTQTQQSTNETAIATGESVNEGIVFPPWVAMDHADSSVRLNGILALIEEAKALKDCCAAVDGEETIPEALFRRVLMDDDSQVTLAAAKGLDELHNTNNNFILDRIDNVEIGEGVLETLYKWIQHPNDDDQIKEQLLVCLCRLASTVAKRLRSSNRIGMTFVRIMEVLGCLMCYPSDNISKDAVMGILFAWDRCEINKNDENLARSLLISDNIMLQGFRRLFGRRNSSELHIRRQLSRVIIDSIPKSSSSTKFSKEMLEYCVWLLEIFPNDFKEDEIHSIRKCLLMGTSWLTANPENINSIICRLASSKDSVFNAAVDPFILSVCDSVTDKHGDNVEPISVVMESVLSTDSLIQIKNLLLVATKLVSNGTVGNFYVVSSALALTCSNEEEVRGLAVDFLSVLGDAISKRPRKDEWRILSVVCQYFAENKSSVVFRGKESFSESLATIVSSSKEPSCIQKYLLHSLFCSITGYAKTASISLKEHINAGSWLGSESLIGGYKTGVILLDAFEISGENYFPLLTRWQYVGKPILSLFLSSPFGGMKKVSRFQSKLIQVVVRMLKGVMMPDLLEQDASHTTTIITTGPSSLGQRLRSYSFGKNDEVDILKPYPEDMQALIVSILTEKRDDIIYKEVQTCLYEIVLGSNSWMNAIFVNLHGKTRQKIANAILNAASTSIFPGVDTVFLSLPLNANDTTELLADQHTNEVGLSKMTFIFDFISANHQKLVCNPGINELFAFLLKKLYSLSEVKENDDDSFEFVRNALLNALLDLINSSLKFGSMDIKFWTQNKQSWLDILAGTIMHDKGSTIHFMSRRSRRTIFQIFAALCEQYPKIIVPNFIPIIIGAVSELIPQGEEDKNSSLTSSFDLLIPVYFKHSVAANLSPVDLFQPFTNHVCTLDERLRPKVYDAVVHALAMVPKDENQISSSIGSFLSIALAREIHFVMDKDPEKLDVSRLPEIITNALFQINTDQKMEAVWTMQNYAKEVLLNLLKSDSVSTVESNFSLGYLTQIVLGSTNKLSRVQTAAQILLHPKIFEKLCFVLIIVSCDVLASHASRNIMRRADGSGSTIILRLWQDLLLIQSACHNQLGGSRDKNEAVFLKRIVEITSHALDGIQNSLPSHIFLAFVSNLITEGETEELRARAVQLVVDRTSSVHLGKTESILFLDMIPPLLHLLESEKSDFLLQSIFSAVDSIGRNVSRSLDSTVNNRCLEIFSDALFKASYVIEKESLAVNNDLFSNIPSTSRQVVSSAILCSSTGINICGPRALPVLAKLIKPLLRFQLVASKFLKSSMNENNVKKTEISQAKMMQLAILRGLISVIENMPMLIKPYLVDIIKGFSQVNEILQNSSMNHFQSIQTSLEALHKSMTSRIPARQLIPAISKSIMSTENANLILPTISIMSDSINVSKSSEVSSMTNIVHKTATYVFDQGFSQENSAVIEATNGLVLNLVMKLSEIQLQSLYRMIREWRGNLDDANPEKLSLRRRAFWQLSCALSKQLKSIYLSCLATVFEDAVDELVSVKP